MTDTPMPVRPLAWSYSRLSKFELCPRQFQALYVTREVKEMESEAQRYGTWAHSAMESYISEGRPMPGGMGKYEPLAEPFRAAREAGQAKVFTEHQMAIDTNFAPCGWRDWKKAYCRAIADVLVVGGKSAVAVDWKTGKPVSDQDQMDILAFITMQHFPEVEEMKLCYVFLKSKETKDFVLTREEAQLRWSSFVQRAARLQQAKATDNWPMLPNGTCKRYCPVTTCPHNGRS